MARTDWAAKIRVAWQRHIDGPFEVGELLIAAKREMPHGKFEAMVRSALPFRERTAHALMAIAKDNRLQRLRKAHHGALLPPSWRTLDELTRLSDEKFQMLLDNGTINPEMRRRDIPGVRFTTGLAAREAMNVRLRQEEEAETTPPKAISVSASETVQQITAPYYTRPIQPLEPAVVVSYDPCVQDAHRLLDILCDADGVVRDKAVELLRGERRDDLATVRKVLEALATALRGWLKCHGKMRADPMRALNRRKQRRKRHEKGPKRPPH